MASIEKTQSLRASITKAVFAPKLLAPPTAYDLAPCYVLDSYRGSTNALTKALSPTISNPSYDRIARRDVAKDIRVAVELVAPISLGCVRAFLIGSSLIAFASNPVTLLLGGPALLLTGKKILDDLRRAFVVDPEVRKHVQLASEAVLRGDSITADQHFKNALAVDVNPTNARNADIYLQQGLLYIQNRRPRQALISLTKASVLIGEHETLSQENVDGTMLKLSKRGVTEMLALACLDSFAKDDAGIEEWNEIAKDFAGSALIRFERFAEAKDAGHLFGLFGIDTMSADANRTLVAKVRFLQAKLESRKNLSTETSKHRLLSIINQGRQLLLDDKSLTQEERAMAFLEQAQFYFAATTRQQRVQLDMLTIALSLIEEAASLYSDFDIKRSIFLRSEAIGFALAAIPRAVEQGSSEAGEMTKIVASYLERLVTDVENSSLDGADEYLLWAYETLYRLFDDVSQKNLALQSACDVATRIKDHVAYFHAAVRMSFLQRDDSTRNSVVAASMAMAAQSDLVISAFGLKYQAELSESNQAGELFRKAAEKFAAAAVQTRTTKQFHPFYLQGQSVVHEWRASTVILHTIGAYCFLRSGHPKEAVGCIEAAEVAAVQLEGADLQCVLDTLRAVAATVDGDPCSRAELDRVLFSLPDGTQEVYRVWIEKLLEQVVPTVPTDTDTATSMDPQGTGAVFGTGTLGSFERKREALSAAVRTAITLVRDSGADDLATALALHGEKLSEGRFNLAMVGEFSTGKSTFINAILGTRLLPSSVRPTTAAVNRIIWAPEPGVTIYFANGSSNAVLITELADYITERRNPGNHKEVAGVEIRHAFSLLKHGITILDTPGIASLIQSHSDITYQTIPSCDAVLLITSATMPFSATEREFLLSLKDQLAGKVFIIINKVDQLSQAEMARVIEFVRENAQKIIPDIRVYPVSSYWALASRLVGSGEVDSSAYADDPMTEGVCEPGPLLEGSRIARLEEDLFSYLVSNKGSLLMESVARNAIQTLNEVKHATDAELLAQQLSIAEVRERVRTLLHRSQQSREQVDSVLKDCEDAFETAQGVFAERLRTERHGLFRSVAQAVESVPSDQLADFDLGSVITEEFQKWATNATGDLCREIRLVVDQAVSEFNSISQELTATYDRSFDLDFSGSLPTISLEDIRIEEETSFGKPFLHGSIMGLTTVLLGPIGGMAAAFGSAYLESKINDIKAKRLMEGFLTEAQRATDEAVQQLNLLSSARFKRISERTVASLREQAESVLRRFERNAASLVEEREHTEEQIGERRAVLKSRTAAIARLLREMNVFQS